MLAADTYGLRDRQKCGPQSRNDTPALSPAEIARQRRVARVEHNRNPFPVPPGWTVKLTPAQLELAPGDQTVVTVDIAAPDGFKGEQTINVNAFAGDRLTGGVTLTVTGNGH